MTIISAGYEFQASQDKIAAIRDKYEVLINNGRERAIETLTRIEAERPQDILVHTDALHFRPGDADNIVLDIGKDGGVQNTYRVHKHALTQAVEKTGVIGTTTATKLLARREPWATELLSHAMNEAYDNIDRERVLLRVVNGELRAELSDKYRRLDSGPIFESFVRSTQPFGAVPTFGSVLDTRVTLTMTLPHIFDVVPNDPRGMVVAGATLTNSDYGDGALSLKLFFLRLICLNGMMREDAFRQVHLGRRLSEDFQYSEQTYALDTQASISAMGDLIRGLLDPAKINGELAMIRRAAETTVDVGKLFAQMRQLGNITKGEEKALVAAYNTPDVEMLPAGNSLWRASNALSLLAQDASVTPERAMELQSLAGGVLNRVQVAA